MNINNYFDNTSGNFVITDKVSDRQMDSAIDVFYYAFKRKIRTLIKSEKKAKAIYKKAINHDRVLYTLVGDKVVGVIGLHYGGRNFMEFKYNDLRQQFNPFTSFFIWFFYKIVSPRATDDVLRIDSVAVDKNSRSMGIGTALIKKVFEMAREKKFNEVILEVVDTNPRAKELYERLGFKEKKLVKYYFLAKPAGFSAEYIMSYKL
jgi:ribosomal protein S18 acetylase RimI-like enzyme